MIKRMIVFLVLIAACTSISDPTVDPNDVYKGTKGIQMSYFENAPPSRVSPNTDMKIALLLENAGAIDVMCGNNCGSICLTTKSSHIQISQPCQLLEEVLNSRDGVPTLYGKQSNPLGGRVSVEFDSKILDVADSTTAPIIAEICYPYESHFSTAICVETAHYSVDQDVRVCQLKTLTFSNQGAPVAVTKVEQDTIRSTDAVKPRITVYLTEVGTGTVYDGSAVADKCNVDIEENLNKVLIKEATLSEEPLNCQGRTIQLGRGPTPVVCTLDAESFAPGQDNNVVSTLKMVLSYAYRSAETVSVEIDVFDKPPEIKRAYSDKDIVEKGEKVKITIVTEDPLGIEKIELFEANKGHEKACNGKVKCEESFDLEVTQGVPGDTIEYTAIATDSLGQQSVPEIVSVRIAGITKFELPTDAFAGQNNVFAKISAVSAKGIEKIQIKNLGSTVATTTQGTYNCNGLTECENVELPVTIPKKGTSVTIRAIVTTSEGNTITEEKSINILQAGGGMGNDDE